MTLFDQKGHLTDEGLDAVVNGALDEMQSLEAAEHLSFCDECLVRYTQRLQEPVCVAPPQDLTLPVMRRLRKRAAQIFLSRYGTAAAAVVLAFCLMQSGFFSRIVPSSSPEHDRTQAPAASPTQVIQGWLGGMTGALDSLFREVSGGLNSTFDKNADRLAGQQGPKNQPDSKAGATQTNDADKGE